MSTGNIHRDIAGYENKAEECWEEISRLDPSHPETLYNRALTNWRSGQVTGPL